MVSASSAPEPVSAAAIPLATAITEFAINDWIICAEAECPMPLPVRYFASMTLALMPHYYTYEVAIYPFFTNGDSYDCLLDLRPVYFK
jgi:hypothetical protein